MKKQPNTLRALLITLVICVVVAVLGSPILCNDYFHIKTLIAGVPSSNSTQATPSQSDSVVGDPDLSAHTIDTILKNASSPAYGIGQALYQGGAEYHIKPSFALAVFHMESGYGTKGVAVANHSIGNIRSTQGGYQYYRTWADSGKAFYQLIKTNYIVRGLLTPTQIIPVYAPSSDGNNPAQYIQVVQSDMAAFRSQQG